MELEVANTTQLELEVQHLPTENAEVAESDRMKDVQHHPMEVRVVHMAYKSLTSKLATNRYCHTILDHRMTQVFVTLSGKQS